MSLKNNPIVVYCDADFCEIRVRTQETTDVLARSAAKSEHRWVSKVSKSAVGTETIKDYCRKCAEYFQIGIPLKDNPPN